MQKILLSSMGLASVLVAIGSLPNVAFAKTKGVDNVVFSQPIYLTQSTTVSTATLEQKIHVQINNYRATKGKPPLTLNTTITKQARLHSQNMAARKVPFGHQGFSQRVSAIASVFPIMAAAENVAYNWGHSDPATVAVRGWINSPGHRFNIEGNYNLTGIGVAKSANGAYYFTQIFIRRR